MHLVIVTNELASSNCSSGGLASFTANMARIFKSNGHKVTVILVTTGKEEIVFDEDICLHNVFLEKDAWERFDSIAEAVSRIWDIDRDEVRKSIVNICKNELVRQKVREIHEKEKIDLIHLCNFNCLGLTFDDEIPYVVRISSYRNVRRGAELPEARIAYEENPLTIKEKLDAYALQKARYIISPSNLLAEIGRRHLGIDPVVIESPFVLDRNSWDSSLYDSLVKGKKYIIHYGRMSYFKGTHIVARIARPILEKYPDRVLVLAGNSAEMECEGDEKVKAHELVIKSAGEYADRIIYAGCLVREQLYPLIQHAELCLLPSRIENLSNACIEAMAMGKIVIATDGASYEQLIEDRVSGFLCERDDPGSFMRAVEEALTMEEEAKKRMLAMAAARIEELAPDRIYKKYYDFYQKVIREWNCIHL